MHIHQFVHTLNYGDAISDEALAIRRILREMSHESTIYSVHAHEKVEELARDYRLFAEDLDHVQAAGERTAVILHYSIASPLNSLFLSDDRIVRGMIYHNLTPVQWFRRYNARVAKDLEVGLSELPELLGQVDLLWGDSTFNCSELQQLGASQVEVLPLFLDEEKWSIRANSGIEAILRAHGGKNILHVGRLAPNKCIEDIIKAFYFYHHKIEKKSRLWLIGSDVDTEIYSFELRQLVSELRLKESVSFVGAVSNCELKAFYENADLYLCLSEHEGFCLPLLEAMRFQVPVIAFDACAVQETLGDGGILLARKSPAEIAELMDMVIADSALKRALVERGQQRVRMFEEKEFARMLQDKVVDRLISEISRSAVQG